MSENNRLARLVKKIESLPGFLQKPALNFALRRTVKLVGTAKVEVLMLTKAHSEFRLKNRTKVQNHIGTIHAAGMALIAETATGMVVGMNVPDDKVPVIKTLKVDFLKRAKGDLVAKAHLTEQQVNSILTLEKGEVEVAVSVTDEEGKEPINCQMIWAWTPKRS
ncbi:DUF4442 domain-containing protein [Kangiella sediminilitoris]|uniref:DUF4442 domain-containing protein n=1 Tax=Kangiella sediminilitoris TaxID=1144748 RepID=A0A1B3BC77_9GAMM|nr:DUF4442 domain-containing protein [Kangiella sediminilitoris]AOE50416.1 hypothetical protein KS2013_1706 [Kangiella sediminilitoris]